MRDNREGKGLNVTLLVCAIFFLTMGCTDIGDDLFGVLLGFSTAIPLAAVYIWRKLRLGQGKSVQVKGGTIALFIVALFFLMMGITGFTKDKETVLIGLVPGIPLAALYLWRRVREYRDLDAQKKAAPVPEIFPQEPQRVERPAPAPAPEREKPVPVTVCPHCGAPGKGDICPYCGMAK